MSEPASRLPARPSVEQLRKRAKELLRDLRAGHAAAVERIRGANLRPADDVSLADAQFVLAREHGFDSWAKLVHHVQTVQSSGRIEQFERLAADVLAADAGDAEALERLGAHFGVSYTAERFRELLHERLSKIPGVTGKASLADIRLMIARQYGFES